MLTPLALRVISRIRCLNRSSDFGAIVRLMSGPAVKLNPRNFRSCGRATALFASFTLSLSFCVMKREMLSITRMKKDLREVYWAPNRAAAEVAIDVFAEKYRAKYGRAVECLAKDRDALLAFYDFPAEHWDHLRTTNPI